MYHPHYVISGTDSHTSLHIFLTKRLFNLVGTQQIIYYQSINLATCFGSLSHHKAKSQTIFGLTMAL
jgi:hypothetical protein